MKSIRFVLMLVLCICVTASMALARTTEKSFDPDKTKYIKEFRNITPNLGVDMPGPFRAAAAGTTILGAWDFDSGPSCIPEGWVGVDLSAQTANWWHVDDFAGLSGGDFGGLVSLEGSQSLWLGARPDAGNTLVCGYYAAPGYGHNWDQTLTSTCFAVEGDVEFRYWVAWSSEPNYDGTTIEYDNCDGNWLPITTGGNAPNGGIYWNTGAQVDTADVGSGNHSGSVRFRFRFTSDVAGDDEDGVTNTDGAIVLDSLFVSDSTGTVSYEDFESASLGDQVFDDWTTDTSAEYGNFTGMFPGLAIVQEDPCRVDLDCMWTFFNGSTATYACGGFAAQAAVPYGNARGQFISNQIWTPPVSWTGSGSIAEITFQLYRDLPLDGLVFYTWAYRSWYDLCPGGWEFDFGVYFGDDKDWFPQIFSFAEFVDPTATHVQLALGVWDLCGYWCGVVGSGSCHSQAPMIDDVVMYRVDTGGPIWDVDGYDLFQDNFATDGTVTGTVRLDMASDILPRTSLGIVPGDSVIVTANDPEYGIAGDSYTSFGPAVYLYARVDPPQASKGGEALVGDWFRYPLVDSLTAVTGDTWYIFRCDSSFGNTAPRTSPIANEYCVDLNDNLLTPGDTLWFFFGGKSADGGGSMSWYYHQPRYTESVGVGAVLHTGDINVAIDNAEEMTCLPAAGLLPGNDILYVDDFSNRGSQPYFDTAFEQLGIMDKVDRYDVRDSDSGVSNGLGGRVSNIAQQLIPYYKKIIWYSGDLTDGLIADGVVSNDKGNDFAVLYTFIDQSPNSPGLWVSGDYNATEWASLGTAAPLALKNAYMNFNVLNRDHKAMGLGVSPRVIGVAGGAFDNITGPDTLLAFGGCPKINKFDVLQQAGVSVVQANYNGSAVHNSSLSQRTTNAGGSTASILLEGFGFHYIRDDAPTGIMDRVIHLKKVLAYLGNVTDEPTGVDPTAYHYSLSQNYPNPFNPTTTISYTVRTYAPVSLRIYNVAGQLIRTLVDEMVYPGQVHTASWDGRNNVGQSVSSGVYFYKLVAGDFVQTKKMVLLK